VMDLTSASLALKSLSRRNTGELAGSIAIQLQGKVHDVTSIVDESDEDLLRQLASIPKWECCAAALCVFAELLDRGEEQFQPSSASFRGTASQFCIQNLEHKEPRVRTCVVKTLEKLCKLNPSDTWKSFGDLLCDIVDKSFTLDQNERAKTQKELSTQDSINDKLLIHETVGWKALETSMRGLESLIRGLSDSFSVEEVDIVSWNHRYLILLVTERSLLHENRYVREVGYDLCAALVSAICVQNKGYRSSDVDAISCAVCRGLEDNWSQVRFAASVATRNLLLGLVAEERQSLLSSLLPRMCLNRYYLAEGVKLYSQETWRLVFNDQGPVFVASEIKSVVDYYSMQSNANNHAVREAACYCIAELATKIDSNVVCEYVSQLLQSLIDAFHDDSWPVRDAACIASGKFVCGFPVESESRLEELFQLWYSHLSDNIWSVREDSAVSLGHVMKAYPGIAKNKILEWIPELLSKILLQQDDIAEEKPAPSSPRSVAGAESEPRGVVQGKLSELRQEQEQAYSEKQTNQQMYSCGSLAPKLKRRGVGCMDHGFSRAKKLWEETDGGIYLLKELSVLYPTDAEAFMPALGKVAEKLNCTVFENANDLQVTLWKQLIPIALGLGKRPFKKYIELFLPFMIDTLSNGTQLAAAAAGQCLSFLFTYLGEGIVTGRIENLLNGDRLLQTVKNSPLVSIV